MAMTDERTAVLIVRVWVDRTRPGRVYARITQSLDVSSHQHTVSTAGSVMEICTTVQEWLRAFLKNDDTPARGR
jgi:hypothetical protein